MTARPTAPVPEGWRVARLGEVCEEIYRYPTYYGVEYVEDGVPEVRGELITTQGTLPMEPMLYRKISPQFSAKFPRTQLKEGDFVLTARGTIGKVAYVPKRLAGANITANLLRISPKREVVFPRWLKYVLLGLQFQRLLEAITSRTTINTITSPEIKALSLLLPPLAEQRAIAAVLDSIDEAIERTEEVIAATERLRDALLHELLTRGLPGHHTAWRDVPGLGAIPACWEVVRLRDVLVLHQPGAWGDDPTPEDPGVRVLRAADLTRDGRVNPETAAWRRLSTRDQARRLMKEGDLMLERSGGGPGTPVGRVALIETLGPVYCNNFCQQLRVDSKRLQPRYTLRALWYRYLRGVTARLEHQTTGIRNLDYDGYLTFPMPLPPLPEQRAIAATLDSVDVTIEGARAERAALQSSKASTADALLTGRVRVRQVTATWS